MNKIIYALESMKACLDGKHSFCPSCESTEYTQIDDKAFRKFPTSLRCCAQCHLLYRHPITLPEESKKFYESEYVEKGLTTELPSDDILNSLLDKRFMGSEKDFSSWMPLFEALSMKLGRPLKVLDYGANWGYTVFQLEGQSFVSECVGYEYSNSRSAYGKAKLGITYIDIEDFDGTFDVIFTSHVIEHLYDPALFRKHADAILKEDGYVILTCPNGSMTALFDHPKIWRQKWGLVHPNMISDAYLVNLFGGYNGGVFDENLSETAISAMMDYGTVPVASLLPKTGHLLAVMSKKH